MIPSVKSQASTGHTGFFVGSYYSAAEPELVAVMAGSLNASM